MKKLAAITLTTLTILALAGCGAAGEPQDPQPVYAEPADQFPSWRTYQLPDGRRVSCIRIYGGISCDWNHTDGADKVEDSIMAVTKRKAEMVVTWHERGVDIETTCRMLGVTPQEASAIIRQHAAERERRERAERMRPKFDRTAHVLGAFIRLYMPVVRLQKERKNGSELPELR